MSNPIEAGKNLRRGQEALNSLRGALLAFEDFRGWLPALNTRTAGRGMIAGMLGLMSIACSPKPEPTTTPQAPIVQVEPTPSAPSPRPPEPLIVQKEVLQRKPGIYAKVLTLEQTGASLKNTLNYAQLPVERVIEIDALDPQNPNNTAGFGFVETADKKPWVVFETADNKQVILHLYTVAATVDVRGQKLAVEWITAKEQQAFLRFVLDKKIEKQANETDAQYAEQVTKVLSDSSYQQEIQDALGKPERIEQVVIANPYTNKVVVFDLKKEPNLLEQLLALFSPKTAYAASLPPRPTPAPTPATGYQQTKEGTVVYKPERGETLNVPQVPGLHAELKEIDGRKKVIYLAEKDNPYGLKESVVAGIYYPDIYFVVDNLETAKQVGGVGLRAEVVSLLMKEARAPEVNPLFPLPIDPTFAAEGNKLMLQVSKNTAEGANLLSSIYIKAPPKSRFVYPLDEKAPQRERDFRRQRWGGTNFWIGMAKQLLNQFSINASYAGPIDKQLMERKLGAPAFEINTDNFPEGVQEIYKKYRAPQLVINPNLQFYGIQLRFALGGIPMEQSKEDFPFLGLGEENMLKKDNSFVFILSTNNPLLD